MLVLLERAGEFDVGSLRINFALLYKRTKLEILLEPMGV